MTFADALALIGFAFVMSITPGPGNLLLLASGANFGFRRSLPLVLGISGGFLSMTFCVGLGVGRALAAAPAAALALKLACAAYVGWLAWRLARSRVGADGMRAMARPIRFIEAAMLQLVNPKAWAVALIVTVSFGDPDAPIAGLLRLIAMFALVNLPSISLWAAAGAALARLIGEGGRLVWFNRLMAALLVASMAPALLGG